MRRIVDNDYLTIIVRLVVGMTFIYASVYKIVDPQAFAKSIWYYHLVPGNLINLLAITLPWIELLCGLCLIIGISYKGAVVLVNLMTVVFIVALLTAVFRGINIDCGCFKAGKATNKSTLHAVWFDLGLLVLTIQLLFSRSQKWLVAPS